MRRQDRLDLAQLDPHPTHLHLTIHPPQVLDLPRSPPPPQIPRPVQPLRALRRNRVRHKPLPRHLRLPPVPQRQSIPPYIDLPSHSHRHHISIPIQTVHLRVTDRSPDRTRPRPLLLFLFPPLVPGHVRRHFRRSV